MKIIKIMVEKIEEEMRDAESYAKLALTHKEDNPELSDLFLNLSKQETTHATMLHTQAERIIKEYREKGNEPPAAMLAVWTWEHGKMIDNMARIKAMQDMVR